MVMEMLAAALLGLVAGFINALSTGGGLLAVPGLIFMGLSPAAAIGTSRMGVVGSGISSSIRYQRSRSIAWRYVPYFIILAIIAGVIGPRILLSLPQELIEKGVAILMLALLPVLLMQKDMGVKDIRRTRTRKIIGTFLMFLVLLYSTMFGAGSGILYVYVLVYMFGLTIIEANATCTIVSMVGSAVALATYIHSGVVVFHLAIPLTVGALLGGYLGARMALTRGSAWVKWILAGIIVISSAKLLLP